jgi:predicted XRE-type DNA-binding protein
MSVISNIHTAQVYDAKTSKPFDGQRLVVTIAKKDKDGNYGQHLQQTMCTSIPMLTSDGIDFNDKSVQFHAVEYFKTIQNQIIADSIKNGTKSFASHELEQNAILAYLEAETVGDRWTSERVAQWFESNIAIPFTEKLMEKGMDDATINERLKVTQSRFADTLSSKAKVPTAIAEKLTQVLKLADCENDAVYKRFHAKLNPPTIADALDFGF